MKKIKKYGKIKLKDKVIIEVTTTGNSYYFEGVVEALYFNNIDNTVFCTLDNKEVNLTNCGTIEILNT